MDEGNAFQLQVALFVHLVVALLASLLAINFCTSSSSRCTLVFVFLPPRSPSSSLSLRF